MQTRLKETAVPIVRRLRALTSESPDLGDAAALYEAVLPILFNADLHVAPLAVDADHVRAKMGKGLTILHDLDLELDVDAARELMHKLSRALETTDGKSRPHTVRFPWQKTLNESGSAAYRVRLALEQNRLDVSALLTHVAAGESGLAKAAARRLLLDPELVWTLAQNALKPALRAWCRQTAPLAKDIPWRKDACFVCGAPATLAELQDNDQIKHLRCGSCGADWQVPRLQCAHCGNEDHKTQRHVYVEGRRERMWAEACDNCRHYLKVIPAFTPTPPEMLPIEDLATLHLDYAARERGYTQAAISEQPGAGF